jgi:drug/metabolite transporter (DMT)-like permease
MGADRVFRRTEPMTSALALAAGAALANATFALAFGGNAIPEGPAEWLRVAGMAVFTLGAFVAMLAALRRIGAVRNAIIGVIEPLTVALLAWVFLAQPVTWSVALGGVAILGAAVLATVARAPARSPAPEPNL